jgi:hypothetical protein
MGFFIPLPDRKKATKVMVVLSKATGLFRRVYDHDDDNDYLQLMGQLHPGEIVVFLTHEEFDNFEDLDNFCDYVAQKVGFEKAPSHEEVRHAHVDDDGVVINFIRADLTCGDSGKHLGKGHKLIKHSGEGDIGWIHKNGKFHAPKDDKHKLPYNRKKTTIPNGHHSETPLSPQIPLTNKVSKF